MTEFLLKPKLLQIELSSFCNALCLGCHRTNTKNYNSIRPSIPKNKIVSVETFTKLLNSNIMASLEELEFCGTIDEPTMHPNFLEILHTVQNKKKYRITIHTNGSTRDPNYWKKLAEVCKLYPEHLVLFNIDGLEDTNHIYRQYTNFNKIIENAKAFIDAGGETQWQFIIFPWNKHQIQEASKLSNQLGFDRFVTRHDSSHITNDSALGGNEALEDILEKKKLNIKMAGPGDPVDYSEVQNRKIECNSLSKSMYFVSCDSKLWPCCFIPNGFYLASTFSNYLHERMYKNYDENFNDLTKFSADEIVNHAFYKNDLVTSFNNKVGTGCTDKISRCADTCTVNQLKKIPIGKVKEYVA